MGICFGERRKETLCPLFTLFRIESGSSTHVRIPYKGTRRLKYSPTLHISLAVWSSKPKLTLTGRFVSPSSAEHRPRGVNKERQQAQHSTILRGKDACSDHKRYPIGGYILPGLSLQMCIPEYIPLGPSLRKPNTTNYIPVKAYQPRNFPTVSRTQPPSAFSRYPILRPIGRFIQSAVTLTFSKDFTFQTPSAGNLMEGLRRVLEMTCGVSLL